MLSKKKASRLIVSLFIPLFAGFIGSFFTMDSIPTWYTELSKPAFNPPNWLFGPVWTVLYILIGISLYLVWNKESIYKKTAIYIFLAQIILNSLWSIIFFGMKMPFFAFIEIMILWLAIALNVLIFYRISKMSAYLLVPYILWVSFAAVLNFSIYLLN